MGTGKKIALGCGVLALAGGLAVVVAVGFGTYWAKGKLTQASSSLEKFSAKTEELEKWEKQANANPFTAPADSVIEEPQLRKFLDVRKEIYAVYQQHKPEFESLERRTKGKKDLSFSETLEAGGEIASLVTDIRLVQAKALATLGMSEEEYRYIQMSVYKTAWAKEAQKELGKNPSEAIAESIKQARGGVREAVAGPKEAGVSGAPGVSETDVAQTEQAVQQMGHEMAEGMKALEVPQANIELFRKYEADIDKYAMHGLAMAGL